MWMTFLHSKRYPHLFSSTRKKLARKFWAGKGKNRSEKHELAFLDMAANVVEQRKEIPFRWYQKPEKQKSVRTSVAALSSGISIIKFVAGIDSLFDLQKTGITLTTTKQSTKAYGWKNSLSRKLAIIEFTLEKVKYFNWLSNNRKNNNCKLRVKLNQKRNSLLFLKKWRPVKH